MYSEQKNSEPNVDSIDKIVLAVNAFTIAWQGYKNNGGIDSETPIPTDDEYQNYDPKKDQDNPKHQRRYAYFLARKRLEEAEQKLKDLGIKEIRRGAEFLDNLPEDIRKACKESEFWNAMQVR